MVIWKVIGDQAVHIVGGLVELMIFLPIWIWSYRRMCLTRRIKTGKDTWQVVEYKWADRSNSLGPRVAHLLVAIGITLVVLTTVFSY